jgi:hypothetical protein
LADSPGLNPARVQLSTAGRPRSRTAPRRRTG